MKDLTPAFDPSFLNLSFDWKGMKTLGVVVSARMEGGTFNSDDISIRYYISSAELTAEKLAKATREHWFIENKLHWKIDVAMNEDDCRIRRGNAPEMLTVYRHIAVNLLNNTTTFKAGLKRKQRKAAMSTYYLSQVLAGCGAS